MPAHPFGIREQRYIIDAQEGDTNAAAQQDAHPPATHAADQTTVAYVHEGDLRLISIEGVPG